MTRAKKTKTPAAQWLSDARKAAGLTQQRLADLLGIPKGTLGNYEQGRAHFPDDLAAALATSLGRDESETRRALGLWVGDRPREQAPSLEQAIRADPRLLPEAKAHLINQVGLLLRIQRTDSDVLQGELRKVEEAEERADHPG